MRHHRMKKLDHDFRRLAYRKCEIRHGPLGGTGHNRLQGICKFINMGDATIEAQPLYVLGYLRQRPMGGLAYQNGGVRKYERRGRWRAAGELRRLIDESPQPLNETPCALDAFFGPDHIAFRWRIGEHEPSRRISPE